MPAEAHDVLVFPDNIRVHDVSQAHSTWYLVWLILNPQRPA